MHLNFSSLISGPINFLIRLLRKAIETDYHRYMGFSARELAEGLKQIAINDNNKKTVTVSSWSFIFFDIVILGIFVIKMSRTSLTGGIFSVRLSVASWWEYFRFFLCDYLDVGFTTLNRKVLMSSLEEWEISMLKSFQAITCVI